MATRTPSSPTIVGLIRVNDHCMFTWRGTAPEAHREPGPPPRTIDVTPQHCEACVAEVRDRLGFVVREARPTPQELPPAPFSPERRRLSRSTHH